MIKTSFTPPTVDFETVDHYVAKARRERSLAIMSFFRELFSKPENSETPLTDTMRRKARTA